MSRALRLHEKHTKGELVAQLEALHCDPQNQADGSRGLQLLTVKAQRQRDDILLAIYWHDSPKGNTRMQRATPAFKWW